MSEQHWTDIIHKAITRARAAIADAERVWPPLALASKATGKGTAKELADELRAIAHHLSAPI